MTLLIPFRRALHRVPTPRANLLAGLLALPLLVACGSDSPHDGLPPGAGQTGGSATSGGGDGTDGGPTTTGGDTGTSGGVPAELGPLPSPPLTEAPSADDEPLVQDGRFHTGTDVPVLVDRLGPPGPPPPTPLTEADFDAGAPEPVVVTDPGVDATGNGLPFFEGLEPRVALRAGELLELRFQPFDPDGGVADDFFPTFYRGARYVDNDDGSTSFLWRPYQADVGIRDFVAFATDAQQPGLRVAYTTRIKVELPSDPASIENVPPFINGNQPYTVRVGDPVVAEITATDANGTLPMLEIANLPPGATLVADRDRPEVHVLRYVPDAAGTTVLELIARDALEPSLTYTDTLSIDARPAAAFQREGARLRELAAARDFRIGHASSPRYYTRPDGALYEDTAAAEFNLVTPENAMKWDYVNPFPGDYRWADPDNLVAWAKANDVALHGHALVWYAQLPPWILESDVADREGLMREHIDRLLTRYADDVTLWDVVNEALDDDGAYRRSVWFEAMGENYVDIAFRQARASAPNATLIYNEYDTEVSSPKVDATFALIDRLQANGTPLDGIGFQMHLFSDFDDYDTLAANMAEVAARDLDIYITELDVSLRDEGATEAEQAAIYERVLSICLEQPRCRALQSWGFTDRHSWRARWNPLLLDTSYQTKPAYEALQRRLGEN